VPSNPTRVLCGEDDEDSRELLTAILKQGKPNAWYLVVQCKSCGVRRLISRAPSQGKAEILRDYKHSSVECGHADVYSVEDIERYRHKAA
jgi:hypothetical protein